MNARPPDDDWTREESRFVDGELDPTSAERLEETVRRDPKRAARIEAWEEAMDLWRDDTRHRASRLNPAVLADRVLRQIHPGDPGSAEASDSMPGETRLREIRATQRYAAAALLLIGLGVGGSLWLGRPTKTDPGDVPTALRAVEAGRLAIESDRAWQVFSATDTRTAEEER